MKKFILIYFLLNSHLVFSNIYRLKLDSALKSELYCEKLIKELEPMKSTSMQGYLGVAYVMYSNHCSMPWNKLGNFNKGKSLLDKTISATNNIEFIYYRYEIQRKIPKGLKYNNMSEDQKKLKAYIDNLSNKNTDPELYIQIKKIVK